MHLCVHELVGVRMHLSATLLTPAQPLSLAALLCNKGAQPAGVGCGTVLLIGGGSFSTSIFLTLERGTASGYD